MKDKDKGVMGKMTSSGLGSGLKDVKMPLGGKCVDAPIAGQQPKVGMK